MSVRGWITIGAATAAVGAALLLAASDDPSAARSAPGPLAAPSQEVPDDLSQDVGELRREVRQLRGELANLKGIASPSQPSPAPEEQAPDPDVQREQREIYRAHRDERQQLIEGELGREGLDAQWTEEVRERLETARTANPGLAGVTLLNVDCRQTLCRVEFTEPEGMAGPTLVRSLLEGYTPLAGSAMLHRVPTPSGRHTYFLFGRPGGAPLPDVPATR